MKDNKSPRKIAGLSLVEILVSMLVFSLVMSGLVNLFVSTRRITAHHRYRMTAAELGRYYLERLQMHVRQDWWDNPPNDPPFNNLLTVGDFRAFNLPVAEFPQYDVGFTPVTQAEEDGFEEPSIQGITYYPVYQIFDQAGVRKVRLAICWIEPTI